MARGKAFDSCMEVVAQDAVLVDEEGLSLLLLQVRLGLHPLLSVQYCRHHSLLLLPTVSGPVQTSPTAQSPTVQASSDPRTSLSLKHFVWDEAITAMLKVAWEKLCTDQFADFTYRMRRSGKKRSETGGDGAGPSRHTGGSISAIEIARILAKELGREPTPMEVFTYTHTKDHDLNTFVDRRAENYTTARERLVSSQADEFEAELRIDEVALYLEAIGGEKKRKEFTALRARVDDQQKKIAKLRAHVIRLSSQPDAGTSSSDPAPATDRNVSTSQQQPLPSPNPDATDDTLFTPLGTIAHPAGTPPGDSTLDRADDQPRGFDFAPF
ncbi:hypothetical protein JCGZ_12720 [Jatropha curcas]|uniref:Uncharacterized protein n=1 Tax=Jatropha curcas TaxID=180498 RepID=A0A067KDZ9_JATCU|nr:hypothetical protein JCGZ_12720 [Jatropha curcas]